MSDLREIAELTQRFAPMEGHNATALPGVCIYRASKVTEPIHAFYEPSLCIVAQGRKRSMVGNKVFVYDEAKYLVISVGVPILSQHIDATPERPFLCMRLRLDPTAIANLMIERNLQPSRQPAKPGPPLIISDMTPELIDAAARLLRLLTTPNDIPALAPLIEREILYRLVCGQQTATLGHIAFAESRLYQVNRVIAWIIRNFKQPFSMEAAAAEANMSPSALHAHFKAVTTFSPLQYQKQLRLQEARRLILVQSHDAAAAAFAVGYESPSQFSREYRRLFGAPPATDVKRLRAASVNLDDA